MKRMIALLALVCFLSLSGCAKSSLPEEMPEDFSFSIRWSTYGTSFYSSRTGKLIKSTAATHPEDYTVEYQPSAEELAYIYDLIRDLNPASYPDLYQPYKQEFLSEPPHPIILTVFADGSEKQIKTENAALTSFSGTTKKGEKFLSACRAIIDLLTASEEWRSLPEYEVFYE